MKRILLLASVCVLMLVLSVTAFAPSKSDTLVGLTTVEPGTGMAIIRN